MEECGDGPAGARVLRERLKVLAVAGDRLQLAADRAAGCSCCAMRRTCGAAELAAAARPERIEVARPPGLIVAKGDEVEVTLPASRFLTVAGLAYLLPTLAVVGTAGAGMALQLSDLWVGLLCLPALALALIPLARAGRGDGLAGDFTIEAVHPGAGPVSGRCAP
ncbi:SoxR reducing system RseC family protein [Cereibacter azotoformans]|uniref:SoxR reducing system RseC family protein n=1 Tax=Cereibacter azotoformans TaxID=43057 RepID=UPI000C6D0CB5|nr:SoxR reducing system RseC family protein [Cereibacter azotoformans]